MAKSKFWKAWRVFWLFVREFIGWAFVLLSLNIFRICFIYLNNGLVIEGSVAAMVGVMLFRGGLQLVKVAVAARAVRRPLTERDATDRETHPAKLAVDSATVRLGH